MENRPLYAAKPEDYPRWMGDSTALSRPDRLVHSAAEEAVACSEGFREFVGNYLPPGAETASEPQVEEPAEESVQDAIVNPHTVNVPA